MSPPTFAMSSLNSAHHEEQSEHRAAPATNPKTNEIGKDKGATLPDITADQGEAVTDPKVNPPKFIDRDTPSANIAHIGNNCSPRTFQRY